MANWLEKIISSGPPPRGRSLTTARRGPAPAPHSKLPNAAVIYGAAAGALFAIALFVFFAKSWFTGLLIMLPAACLLGFAAHFVKHSE